VESPGVLGGGFSSLADKWFFAGMTARVIDFGDAVNLELEEVFSEIFFFLLRQRPKLILQVYFLDYLIFMDYYFHAFVLVFAFDQNPL